MDIMAFDIFITIALSCVITDVSKERGSVYLETWNWGLEFQSQQLNKAIKLIADGIMLNHIIVAGLEFIQWRL